MRRVRIPLLLADIEGGLDELSIVDSRRVIHVSKYHMYILVARITLLHIHRSIHVYRLPAEQIKQQSV